jgi:hypothetical protein
MIQGMTNWAATRRSILIMVTTNAAVYLRAKTITKARDFTAPS